MTKEDNLVASGKILLKEEIALVVVGNILDEVIVKVEGEILVMEDGEEQRMGNI